MVSDKGRHEVFKRWKSGGCFEIERMILEGERNELGLEKYLILRILGK